MSDPRTTPDPSLITEKTYARIAVPLADLNRFAGHKRDRQVLLGERVTILGGLESHCYVMTEKDNYVGYLKRSHLTLDHPATHRVKALASHAYCDPNMKSADLIAVSHGCLLNVVSETEKFAKTAHGYFPQQHLCRIGQLEGHFVDVAKKFLGTPYLWGGNSSTGIDCSGLVQAALIACGTPCPGDSDQQQAQLGRHLDPDTIIEKGDLLFWKGHIAIAVDTNTLIHANAFHMACVLEPINDAIKRIADQGDGDVTAHKRL